MARGAVREQHQFMPPLRKGDEQRQQNGADEEPVADDDVDHRCARDRPKHEANGQRERPDIEKKIDALISKMTLAEKLGQL